MSAAEVGTGQYATTKGISQTNLITTVTPEKKAEEEHGEEGDRRKKAEEATPVPALRLEGKVQLLVAAFSSCPHLYKQLGGSETVDRGGWGGSKVEERSDANTDHVHAGVYIIMMIIIISA